MSDRPRSLKITIVMPHSIGGANSGDRARTRALADELRTLGHNVAIVAPSWDVMRGDVKLVGDEYLVGQSRTGFAKVIWRASLALRRLYDPNALHHSGHLRSSLGKVVAELMPDVVDVQHSYWHIDVAAPTVVTVHNVLANPSFDSRSRAQRRVRNRYESKALRDGDVIVVFSNQEFDRLTAAHHISDDDISIVEIGHPATIADRSPQAPPEHALFVGSIDYGPNRDAAQRLVRLWDKEGVHLPPLYIVGRRASVLGETSNTKVQIVSDAPELKSYYDTAIAALMPLNHGGGVRLKALEAMAWRVPYRGHGISRRRPGARSRRELY
ncbi:hypothetical protein QE381_002591 [Microbacterium sp. SORGH_AS 888]|nr:hypothetical protein [Microbacterium sp. SORGH_AS_0888]